MLSPTNSWTLHPTRSYTDLLFIQLTTSITTSAYAQIEGASGIQQSKPITLVKSHQDDDISVSKLMAEYNPDDLI